MIKEISTCSYLMIIYTPRLCNDIAFLPPQENLAHPISCQPVIAESEVDDWAVNRIEEKIRETERLVAEFEDNPLRNMDAGAEGHTKRGPIIGGIEVGAQILVGSEGKVIEKSVVVGGGKETFLGTLLTSDGKQMSAAELKKLNMDPSNLEKLKRNSQKIAGRKGWKLDLIETPRGREFRMIIEADEEIEEQGNGDGKGGDEKGRGMGTGKEGEEKDGEQEAGESADGSEEVYKDEL